MTQPKREFTGIEHHGQMPLLEFCIIGTDTKPKWVLWIMYNEDRTQGTYLIPNEDGSIWLETTYPDGGTGCCVIKPATYKGKGLGHTKKN